MGGFGPVTLSDPSAPAWVPAAAHFERSRLARLVARTSGGSLESFRARAVVEPSWFWSLMVEEVGLRWRVPPDEILDMSRGLPFARFFPGAGLNLAVASIDRWVEDGRGGSVAIAWEGEDGTNGSLTYSELASAVGRAANAIAAAGIGPGDRVGLYMPLIPECAVAMFACARLGATFTPIFSGFGAGSVAARLDDSGAKLLITVDGAWRRGRAIPMKSVADEAVALSPTVTRVMVVRRLGDRAGPVPWRDGRDTWWDDDLAAASPDCPAVPTGANDPYMLIYTSGTTGRPKGTRHVHSGFPVKAASDLAMLFDVQPSDRVLWYSDPGWMMAPWLIFGNLLLGATACLYDGAPDWPGPGRLWSLVDRLGVTVLGLAPTVIRGLMRHGEGYPHGASLGSLRALGSSGEPWTPEAWWWYFREVGRSRCPVINYTGGTEVGGGILGCTTIEPQFPCAFTGPVPGMAAAIADANGRDVEGAVGELVVRQPWVGMTQGFWGGPEPGLPGHDAARQAEADARYLETYWRRPGLEGAWVHGDWARADPNGAWFVLGRSDDTIKAAGKRLGPAEVEGAALAHPGVAEAAACGVPDPIKGEVIAVVVVPSDRAIALDERCAQFEAEVEATVVAGLGRALRPDILLAVPDLPKTRNGKVMRRLVRGVLAGDADLGDLSGLDSPGAIDSLREALARRT